MIRNFVTFLRNFFLHIEINTINLPYVRLPRPHRSNPLSKKLRYLFEQQLIRKAFGVNLAALAVVPMAMQVASGLYQEPPLLNVVIPETQSEIPGSGSITTQERTFVMPVERLRYIGQGFRPGHAAYDLNSYVSDDIYAFTTGRVAQVENGQFGLGRYVVLDHGHGLVSVYAHMSGFSVEEGQLVESGEKIGEIGMTGRTTGPHLHFEIHDEGVAVDPSKYLDI